MATRSTIAVKISDNEYKAVYCHWDGYPTNNGKLLLSHYNSQQAAEELVNTGHLSSLGIDISDCEFYQDEKIPSTGSSYYAALLNNRQEYNYLWDGNKWLYNDGILAKGMCGLLGEYDLQIMNPQEMAQILTWIAQEGEESGSANLDEDVELRDKLFAKYDEEYDLSGNNEPYNLIKELIIQEYGQKSC